MNYIELSKQMSFALRHRPDLFGLTLAKDGSVLLKDLIAALNVFGSFDETITEEDIRKAMLASNKKRHAIEGERIRALYGHSAPLDIIYEEVFPPDVLFHGTSEKASVRIQNEGLKSMGRLKVCLTISKKTALAMGRRKDPHPVLLQIDAKAAYQAGVRFYKGSETIFQSDTIPPRFIKVLE